MSKFRKYIDRKNTAASIDRDGRFPITVRNHDTGEVRYLPRIGR